MTIFGFRNEEHIKLKRAMKKAVDSICELKELIEETSETYSEEDFSQRGGGMSRRGGTSRRGRSEYQNDFDW